jgi:membrane fusion protein, multidrug efflux system
VTIVSSLIVWFARNHTKLSAQAAAPAPAVPITATPAKVQDVPVYLRGLGTVLAFNTVEIKAQVNAMLTDIHVHEGQEVRQGDIVAQIDPRPYQAALDQATAQRAEDAAQLQTRNSIGNAFSTVQRASSHRYSRWTISRRLSTNWSRPCRRTRRQCAVSITQDTPISIVVTLPEAQLPRIHQAMATAMLPVVAYDSDDKTKLADGQLLTPNNAIDTTTGTIQLKATFPNDNDALWPGEFVNARLRADTLHRAVTVPVASIRHGPNGLFLYTVTVSQTTRYRNRRSALRIRTTIPPLSPKA